MYYHFWYIYHQPEPWIAVQPQPVDFKFVIFIFIFERALCIIKVLLNFSPLSALKENVLRPHSRSEERAKERKPINLKTFDQNWVISILSNTLVNTKAWANVRLLWKENAVACCFRKGKKPFSLLLIHSVSFSVWLQVLRYCKCLYQE